MRLGLSSTPYLGRTRGTERDVLAHYATKNSIPSAPAPQRAGLVDEAQAHDMDRRVRGRDHRGDHLRRGTEDAAGVPRRKFVNPQSSYCASALPTPPSPSSPIKTRPIAHKCSRENRRRRKSSRHPSKSASRRSRPAAPTSSARDVPWRGSWRSCGCACRRRRIRLLLLLSKRQQRMAVREHTCKSLRVLFIPARDRTAIDLKRPHHATRRGERQ